MLWLPFFLGKNGVKSGVKWVLVVEKTQKNGINYCKVVESGVEWEYAKVRISISRSIFRKVLGGQPYVHGQILQLNRCQKQNDCAV